jgi:long-chain acyl-CoA synthetase
MGLYDFTFYDLVNRNAASFGARPAWLEVDDGRTLTFSQFKEQVDRLACGLQQAGIQQGDRIGALAQNSLEYFILYGAAAALGAVMLPINWRLSADEVAFNLNDCEPKIVFAGSEYEGLIEGIQDKLPSVQKFYAMDEKGAKFPVLKSLLDNQGQFDRPDVSTEDGFVIIHTAAVAGRPRGALLSHGNVMCADLHFDYFFHVTPEDVHLSILPLFHVAGLFMAATAFHAGALNVSLSKFDASQAAQLIEEKGCSLMFTFSPILASVLEAAEKDGSSISSLRVSAGLEAPETIEKYQ